MCRTMTRAGTAGRWRNVARWMEALVRARAHPGHGGLSGLRCRGAALLVVVLALAGCGSSATKGTVTSRLAPDTGLPSVQAPKPFSIYWGARIGRQLTGAQAPWAPSGILKLRQMVGKSLSLVHFEAPFEHCRSTCVTYPFPFTPVQTIRRLGAIPFFSWGSQSTPRMAKEPAFSLSNVIAGRYDGYIRTWAEAAKRWGKPFFLRFDWDMNARWPPWGAGVNGNRPSEFVAAWRHVHDIFRAVGATNATWVWCPSATAGSSVQQLEALYPGNAYVDWTCLDGYNWGTNPRAPGAWMSFDQLFRPAYEAIVEHVAPTKPMVIGEVGSSEDGGSKAEWIADMLSEIPTSFPSIHAVMWSELDDAGGDWPIETSRSATAAFAQGIDAPAYAGGAFGDITRTPIPPPRASAGPS